MSDVIQSVDRALEIMIYLSHEGQETSITKIAADLKLYKSTVYRTLVTLENRGFIHKNPETEKYWLGSRLFVLGKGVENQMELLELVGPYARKLRDAYGEVVTLSILERNPGEIYRSVVILREESRRQSPTAPPAVGSSVDCLSSAGGKCLLAFSGGIDLSVYDVPQAGRARPGRPAMAVPALRVELAKIRERGYAMEREESGQGLVCISAPILNQKGEAAAAIGLSGRAGTMLSGDIEERIEAVKRIAREISGII